MMKENFIASEQVSSILARFTTFIEAKLYKSGGQTMTINKHRVTTELIFNNMQSEV